MNPSVVAVLALLAAVAALCGWEMLVEGTAAEPKEKDRVAYAEFLNDGSLWRAKVYEFGGGTWRRVRVCYPATGEGCCPGWKEIVYPAAASVAGRQLLEIDSDRHHRLRSEHPKSRYEHAPGLWAKVLSNGSCDEIAAVPD